MAATGVPSADLQPKPQYISIAPLLKQLAAQPSDSTVSTSPSAVAAAFAEIFENRISPTQLAAFLTLLHTTTLDRNPEVISRCAQCMRDAAAPIDRPGLCNVLGKRKRNLCRGSYEGGLCDIVGTGGDSHSTFNISTTSSIIASPLLMTAKHGNRAQSSMSGSADVLGAIRPTPPKIDRVHAGNLHQVYETTNYAFLFAPNFHSGMKYAATVRRELGLRTIFNIMGPLANPVDWSIEARVIGVARADLGGVFAESLRLSGVSKAMVVCGQEELDEISCAGKTNCWWIKGPDRTAGAEDSSEESSVDEAVSSSWEYFTLHPSDFGLPTHPLSEVGGRKGPQENAEVLMKLLKNELGQDHPILHFVLMNVAALLVVSGVCDSDDTDLGEVIKETGPAGGRWKEGVRLARWCIESGKALQELEKFIEVSNRL